MRRTTGNRFLRFIPALAIGAGALVALAPGASAAGTAATFSLTSGSLTITQPSTATLGTAAAGSLTLSGALGTVAVSDQRGNLVATWTATVSSTSFTTGGGTAPETVPTSSIAYSAGLPIATSGTGSFVPGVLANLSSPGTAGSWAGGVGVNSASWNPTITFTLSPSQVAGTYTGTITHSVA
jgi:hypothetical protein